MGHRDARQRAATPETRLDSLRSGEEEGALGREACRNKWAGRAFYPGRFQKAPL